MCPAPPEFQEGELIVAFLQRERESGEWEVVSLSYGTRPIPVPEARDAYHARVVEMTKILEMEESKSRGEAILDWLMRCIESPYTRLDGA